MPVYMPAENMKYLDADGPGVMTVDADDKLKLKAQLTVALGGTGADITPAGAGELIYSSSAAAYSHLAAGTSGMALLSGGAAAPTWGTLGLTYGGTNANLSAEVAGGMIYATGSALAATAALTGIMQANTASAPTAITGTANYIPKWSAAAPYLTGTSKIFDDGTNVGIATATPKFGFDSNAIIRTLKKTDATGLFPSGAGAGVGMELMYVGWAGLDYGGIVCYDRENSQYKAMVIDGLTCSINANTGGKVGIGTAVSPSHLQIAGNLSSTAWTTTGIAFDVAAATFTDTSTAGAGTVAVRAANSLGAPTFASTNAITVTDAFTLYVPKPIAGTNTTITRANSAYFEGNVGIGTTNAIGPLTVNLGTSIAFFYGNHSGAIGTKISNIRTDQSTIVVFGEDAAIAASPTYIQRFGSTHATRPNSIEIVTSSSGHIVFMPSSNVGISQTAPAKKLEVLDASAAQLRLTHTAATVYTDFQTTSLGHLSITGSGGFVGIGGAPTSHLQIAGNISAAAWTTTGIAFSVAAATFTDTSTAGAGTVAVRAANSLGAPTFASTNAITVTDAFTLYVPKPIAGANTTITAANAAYFGGLVAIGNFAVYAGDNVNLVLGTSAGAYPGRIYMQSADNESSYIVWRGVTANAWVIGTTGLGTTPTNSFHLSQSTYADSDIIVTTSHKIGFGLVAPIGNLDVNNTTTRTITVAANDRILHVQGALTEAASGVHARIMGVEIDPPTITAGVATVTNTATVYISAAPTCTVTGGNYSLMIAAGNINLGALDVVLDQTTGTKIGTAAAAKLGLWGATPVVQRAHIIDADGNLPDITTKFNTLLGYLETIGVLASA